MKKSYLNILWAMAFPLFMGSCSEEEYSDANAAETRSVEEFSDAISITVNQETNVVTFEFTKPLEGCYPAWEFGPGYSDDKLSSTSTKVTKAYKSRGDYYVNIKIGNKNGLSDGVISKTFHIDRTLVTTNQVKALTGNVLFWNYVANGHFGCGTSWDAFMAEGGEMKNYGLNWWSCGAFGNSSTAMYDDSFTFKTEVATDKTLITGTYEYSPGEDGKILVNKDITFAPFGSFNTNDGKDYSANVSNQSSSWELYYDEANVLWLKFAPQTMVGFIPNEGSWNETKFRVIELTDKKVTLVADNGGISWRYVFVPQAQNEIDDVGGPNYADAIVGTWMWNSTVDGHFGCGDGTGNPLGWWSCKANEKKDFHLYDDIMTFTEDKYSFDPGNDSIYVNTDCTYEPTYNKHDKNDYVAPAAKQTTAYEVVEEDGSYYLTLPPRTIFSYMPGDAFYNSPKLLIKRISKDKSIIELASIQSGIAWFYQLKRVEK